MKRFQFQLQPVLDFKLQRMDALLVELDMLQGKVMAREYARNKAYQTLADYDAEYAEKKATGISVLEAMQYQTGQQVLQQRAKREDEALLRARREEEKKRDEVVEARKETHSLEKLKDMRRKEYDFALAKEEEKSLDDLTAARRAAAAV